MKLSNEKVCRLRRPHQNQLSTPKWLDHSLQKLYFLLIFIISFVALSNKRIKSKWTRILTHRNVLHRVTKRRFICCLMGDVKTRHESLTIYKVTQRELIRYLWREVWRILKYEWTSFESFSSFIIDFSKILSHPVKTVVLSIMLFAMWTISLIAGYKTVVFVEQIKLTTTWKWNSGKHWYILNLQNVLQLNLRFN